MQLFVGRNGAGWRVRVGGEDYLDFAYGSMGAAINAAIAAAQRRAEQGEPAQVLVQGRDHVFRVEWSCGRDR